MKRFFAIFLTLAAVVAVVAQTTPDIRIKTSIYEKDGPTNYFTVILGAAPGHSGYVDVVCSGGNQSEAEVDVAQYNEETGALVGTSVACQVNEEGVVEIFCDEGVVIDYFSCTGAEITSIDFKNPENIEILALEHNILESLDLTPFSNLQALYLNDNPMNVSPLTDNGTKPRLQILEISQIGNIDPAFDIVNYPNLVVFDAMSTYGLKRLSASACPGLQKISIDNTSVSELDLSKNPDLLILNISESRVASIDVSANTKLQQLFATHSSAFNSDVKIKEIDVTHNPDLFYLFLNGNELTSIDVSKNEKLQDLYVRNNRLTCIDLSHNPYLLNVFITGNLMDFNTLPIPSETWLDYDLTQRPLPLPSAYLAGMPIDLAEHIVRSDSETYANLFYISEDHPETMYEVDASKYTFANGVLTINEVVADSVYASFYNGTFPDIELATTMFKVKDETTYGQDDKAIAISNSQPTGTVVKLYVGMQGATAERPKKFFVKLGGSAEKQEFTATSESTPALANVEGTKSFGTITVYVPEGEKITAFKLADMKISGIDLSGSKSLNELTLRNTQLSKLDLKWNRCLRSVDITGNNFGDSFTLEGANGYYGKNVLSHINLSDNNMTEVSLNQPGSWRHIDLSHNQLTSMNFTDADYVEYLDISHNNFEYLKINYLGELKTLRCNDNRLSTIVMPENNVIETLDCANNRLNFTTLPPRNGMDEAHFSYAPQADIEIPSKGPGYNLSGHNVTIDGNQTVFTWKATDGTPLTEGIDYTCNGGITQFDDRTIGKTLYCELTHAAFPAFSGDKALKTTGMYSAGMPTHLLATFKTPVGGQKARLSMTSATSSNAIYIDWSGTRSLEQYPITNTTYTVYEPTTVEGATVKVWSYEENDNLTVFSLSGAALEDVDCSPMTHLTFFGIANSGVSSLVWPASPDLSELSLEGCRFSSFDFSRYPKLNYINFDGNEFETIDLSGLSHLGTAGLANNKLTEVKFGNNSGLWGLALTGNRLEHIDFAEAPNISQLFLNNNLLSSIDLSPLEDLRVIYLDNNRFDFSNLPVPQEQWTIYTYGNQPELKAECVDGKVDLSSQAVREGVETQYKWYYDRPEYDENEGALVGEELYVDEEYTVQNGVTTFLEDIDKACCVLTNELFPRTYLMTNLIAAAASGIEGVRADAKSLSLTTAGTVITVSGCAEGSVFKLLTIDGKETYSTAAANGKATLKAPAKGLYIVATNGAAAKVRL